MIYNDSLLSFLNTFMIELLFYGLSIYDLQNLCLSCKDINMFFIENKRFIRSLVEINLSYIFKNDFNINFNNFQSFCISTGLVLGGSTMFKSMTGPNWGFTSNDVINYIPSPIHDIDLHIDHRKCLTNEKFSDIISRHNLIFDPNQSTKQINRNSIFHFLEKYLSFDDYNITESYND